MNRRSIKIHTLVVILSIILVALEYGCYYFLNLVYPSVLMAVVLNLLLCHIFLENSLTYLSSFLQSLITVLLSAGLTAFIYMNQTGNLLVYRSGLIYIILLNWVIPLLYCILRDFTDHGPRFVNFRSFFWRTSILFAVMYVIEFVIHFFIVPLQFPEGLSSVGHTMIPFMSTAAYIEDCIYLGQSISVLLLYVLKCFLFFLPLGLYASILLKEANKWILVLLTFVLPLGAEAIRYLRTSTFSIDAYLYCFFGFLLGIVFYQILNLISNHCLNNDFLAERNKYSFFNFYY